MSSSANEEPHPPDPEMELLAQKKEKIKIPKQLRELLPDVINPKTLTEAQTKVTICELRKLGWSLDQISYFLGMKKKDVVKRLRRVMKTTARLMYASIEEHILMEEIRMDMLLKALQPGIDKGDVRSIEAALKISDARRKLKGLDEPEKKQINQSIDIEMKSMSTIELAARAEALGIPMQPLVEVPALPGEPGYDLLINKAMQVAEEVLQSSGEEDPSCPNS